MMTVAIMLIKDKQTKGNDHLQIDSGILSIKL
jgi:hypothetical protein